MIGRLAPRIGIAALLLGVLLGSADAQQALVIGYLFRPDDPTYQPHAAYTGLRLLDRHPAIDGARLAMRDSRIVGRAVGISFDLVERPVAEGEDAVMAARDLLEAARIMVLDLPLGETLAVA